MKSRITRRSIAVEFTFDGYHRWPDAPDRRSYLAYPHRHRFHARVEVPVTHDDRQIEFHDLLDACADRYPHGHSFHGASCEQLAAELAEFVLDTFNPAWCEVTVGEDGYVHATIRAEQEPHP